MCALRRALRSATRKALRRVDELWMRHVEAANVLVTVDTAARVRSEYHELHRRELTMLTEDILGGPSPVTLAARNVLASIRYTKQMLLDRFDDEADVLRAAALKQAAEAARVKAEDRVLLRECSHDVDALFTRRQLQEARVAAARFVRIFMLRREQLAQQEARRALELRVPVARAALDQRFEQRQLAVEREERAKELERHRAQAIAVMRAGSPASGARHASSPSPTGTDASPSAGAGGAAQAVSPRSVKFADDVAEPAPGAVAVAGVGASPRAAPRTASPAGAGQRARTPTTLPTHAHGDGDADGTLVVSDGVVESRVNPLRGKQRSATVVVERSAGRELPPLAGSARAARAPTGASTSASASAASGDAGTGASGGAGAGAAAPRDSVSGEVATAAPASLVPGVDEDELRASLAALSVPSLSEPMSLDLPATPRDASAVGAAALADPRDEQQAASAAVAPALVSPATAAIAGRRASRDSAGDGAFSADSVAAMPRRAPAATVYVRRSRDSDTDGDVTATGRRAPASSVYIPASTSALTVAAFAASAVTAGEDVVVLSPGEADQVRQMLDEGALFVKHGRAGRPHKRFVWVPPPYNAVYWGVTRKANARESLMVREIERVVAGQTTAVFKRRSGDDNREDYSFSLVAGERTLDLEADTPARRDVFVRAFRVLLMPGVFKGE